MTFTSFKGLAAAFGVTPPEAKPERARKCKFCGSEMEHIKGTNVWVCHGSIAVPDKDSKVEGATKEIPCTNTIMGRS